MSTVIKADFTKIIGKIKPLHGVNRPRIVYNGPYPELMEAGIPFVRTHDVGGMYGGNRFVDVPNIFRNFDADENDPANYDFTFTDALFKSYMQSGMKIMYRLGVTIENDYWIKAYRINPPEPNKWARICEHIVRHYNEGWADGFQFNIEYWEIWNEPENPPMWAGTMEQYFELYRITSNHLKKCFPQIKIGGYGSCGVYAIDPLPEYDNDFQRSFLTWLDRFLEYITAPETKSPLDFFSWHIYSKDTAQIRRHSDYVDSRLAAFGLRDKTESHLNEWNAITWGDPDTYSASKTMEGALSIASTFCMLQHSGVDKAVYYDAIAGGHYGGLYESYDETLSHTYYAFRMFNELYQLGDEAECSSPDNPELSVLAASGKNGKRLMIVNPQPRNILAKWGLTGVDSLPECVVLDRSRKFTQTNMPLGTPDQTIAVPGTPVSRIELEQGRDILLPARSILLLRWK